MSEKPQCGGEGFDPDSYDLPLHVAAVCKYRRPPHQWHPADRSPVIVFFASIAGRRQHIDIARELTRKRGWLPRRCEEGEMAEDPSTHILCLQAFWYRCPHSDSIRPCEPSFPSGVMAKADIW
jgi:hypothetical protein